MEKEFLHMKIPSDLKREIERLAAQDGRSMANFVTRVLTDFVSKNAQEEQAQKGR